ncbi:MAG: SRPBCC family protein [Archangium sp.]|nr:SRPBCC family protein [Archangium sp.]
MRLRSGLLLSLLCSAAAFAQPVEFPKLTDDEKKKLDADGVVIHELKPTDNKGVSAESIGVVDAPPAEVWPIVRDCEHYSAFLPSTKSSARKVEGEDQLCFDELSLPFPLANLWADTKSVEREEPAGHFHRAWSLVRGTYRRNRGSWTVLPWGSEGKKSLVVYLIDSDPSILVPEFILRAAQSGSLPQVFTGIRKRVKALRAASTPAVAQ